MHGEYKPPAEDRAWHPELPPRARRILRACAMVSSALGTTSACTENTALAPHGLGKLWNYLRVHGEYAGARKRFVRPQELPPRARRIPKPRCSNSTVQGTTSACTENTFARLTRCLSLRNYLRVHGEYGSRHDVGKRTPELPPRAWRILNPYDGLARIYGTTSACTENTWRPHHHHLWEGNYLRVHGEYPRGHTHRPGELELPPRARRIHAVALGPQPRFGTTSACTENTGPRSGPKPLMGNYLRVHGEYLPTTAAVWGGRELPPRARRIPAGPGLLGALVGTTSACAENTILPGQRPNRKWNYLRVRGEYCER